MGYTTDFCGHFTLDKPLNTAQIAYLKAFNETRRMSRDAAIAATLPDPIREAVGLPIGKDGQYFVGGSGFMGQDGDASVKGYNDNSPEQPGLWCQWIPSEDGTVIEWDGGEKFYYYTEWITYIIEHFLKPWGLVLSGDVEWSGEEGGDLGIIRIEDNVARECPGRVTYEE